MIIVTSICKKGNCQNKKRNKKTKAKKISKKLERDSLKNKVYMEG